jgi:hypothetical protein
LFGGIEAIQGFSQRSRERFKFFDLFAGEQISMPQPPACERALQELHALLIREKFEGHVEIGASGCPAASLG